ncbi:MAG TPA: DegV family protein [Anaerolineaceae bacterium]|nr:DegV family protein [Anaerolineaceae bacterium]
MGKIAIVIDSTACMPPELIKGYPIYSAPLQVIWGEESFRDGIDIQPSEFYDRLKTSKITPTSSQVTPSEFKDIYIKLLDEGYDILGIYISCKLSGTMDSAIQAKEMLPGKNIELVDSLSAGMAAGFQVLAVARASQNGATLQECKYLAEKARQQCGVFLVVDTLEYLRRGGRIGGGAAFLGTALNLKPILEIRDGRIEAVEKVWSMSRAIDRMLDLFEKRVNQRSPLRLSALYTNNPEDAELLLERARQRFGINEVSEAVSAPVSPVIGVHIGPGALGLCFMAGM